MSQRMLVRPWMGLAAAVFVLAGPGVGDVEARQTSVRFSPFAGALDPRGEVPDARILATGTTAVSYPDFPGGWSVGGALEVRPDDGPVGLRLSASHAPSVSETGQWGCLPPVDGGPGGCPSILILVPTDIDVTAGALDVVGSLGAGPVELRALSGLGWVRYAYEWDGNDQGTFSLAPGRATRNTAALHLGIGVSVAVAGLRAFAEYGEFLSPEEDRRTTPDRIGSLSLGLEVPLGG